VRGWPISGGECVELRRLPLIWNSTKERKLYDEMSISSWDEMIWGETREAITSKGRNKKIDISKRV